MWRSTRFESDEYIQKGVAFRRPYSPIKQTVFLQIAVFTANHRNLSENDNIMEVLKLCDVATGG